MTMHDMMMKAHDYVDLGMPVIPVCHPDHKRTTEIHNKRCRCPGKTPLIKGWSSWSTTEPEQLAEWIKEFKAFNLGLPLGAASGYVGIDIDGEEGETLFQEMSNGDVPETWEYSTGAGRRLIYTIPQGLQCKKFKQSGDATHTECALLCTGQYTVIPPSVHHTGKEYKWIEGHSPWDSDCAMAPKWLIDAIKLDEDGKKPLTLNLENLETNEPEDDYIDTDNKDRLKAEFSPTELLVDWDELPEDIEKPKVKPAKPKKGKTGHMITVTEEMLSKPIPDGQRDVTMTSIIGHFCARYRGLGKENIMMLAVTHNAKFCKPPLEESAIKDKVDYMWEQEQMKGSKYKSTQDKARYEPATIAQVVLNVWEEQELVLCVQRDRDTIWYCHKTHGPWRALSAKSSTFQAMFVPIISDPENGGDPSWTTSQKLNDIAYNIVLLLKTQGRFWDSDMGNIDTQSTKDCNYIPLREGQLLNWKTGELCDWIPEEHFTYELPVKYEPEADCPYWKARLAEWLPDADVRKMVQEYIGYSFIPYMGFEKALLIIGEGANGKSIFLESIQNMLGYDIIGSCSMKTIFSQFGAQYLNGKILNICNEAASEYLRGSNADEFKNLVSGGRVVADVKNQAAITFNNTAKFIFSANHDIRTTDKSTGWIRRLLIVPFEQDFTKSSVTKTELMSNIEEEQAGIFNWAIEGLRRLMTQKRFTESEITEQRKKEYIAENDIAADFFDNCLELIPLSEVGADGSTTLPGTPTVLINSLFTMWVEYRESSVQKVKKYLKEYFEKKHKLKAKRTTNILLSRKKQTMCWVGIRVNVKDLEFLEMIQEEGEMELREYAMKRLKELDMAS